MLPQDARLLTLCRIISGVALTETERAEFTTGDGTPLLEQLCYHQIAGLAYYYRRELAAAGLPLSSAAEDYLQRYTLLNISRIMAYEHFLKQWHPRLQECGIEYRLFKGIVTAKMFYPEDYLRSFGDLDILIRPADLARVESLLAAEGFTAADDLYRVFPPEIIRKYAFARHYNRRQPFNIAVDLHLNLSSRLHPFQFDRAEFWSNRQSFWLDGLQLQTFTREYQALYTLYHAFKHYFFKLIWFVDAFLLLDQPGLDRAKFRQLIAANRLNRLERHFISLSRKLFGRLPQVLQDGDGQTGRAHHRINLETVLRGNLALSPSRARLLLPIYYLQSWPRRLTYLWRQLLPPMETVKNFYLTDRNGPNCLSYLKLRCRAISDLIFDKTEEETSN